MLLCVPEYVGLALSYGLSLNGLLFWTVYITCTVEKQMVSVERIRQFIRIPSEAPWRIPDCVPSPNWPHRGDIDIKDLQVNYRILGDSSYVFSYYVLFVHGQWRS